MPLRPSASTVQQVYKALEAQKALEIRNNLKIKASAALADVKRDLKQSGRRPGPEERRHIALALRYAQGGSRAARRTQAKNFHRS